MGGLEPQVPGAKAWGGCCPCSGWVTLFPPHVKFSRWYSLFFFPHRLSPVNFLAKFPGSCGYGTSEGLKVKGQGCKKAQPKFSQSRREDPSEPILRDVSIMLHRIGAMSGFNFNSGDEVRGVLSVGTYVFLFFSVLPYQLVPEHVAPSSALTPHAKGGKFGVAAACFKLAST